MNLYKCVGGGRKGYSITRASANENTVVPINTNKAYVIHGYYNHSYTRDNYLKVTYIKNGEEITKTFDSKSEKETDFVCKVFGNEQQGVYLVNVNAYKIVSVTLTWGAGYLFVWCLGQEDK